MTQGFDRMIIRDHEEKHAPPTLPVLELVVVGDVTFLTISKEEETNKVATFTKLHEIGVDTNTLLQAILTAVMTDG